MDVLVLVAVFLVCPIVGKVTRSSIAKSVLYTIVDRDYFPLKVIGNLNSAATRLLVRFYTKQEGRRSGWSGLQPGVQFLGPSSDGPCVGDSIEVTGRESLARTGAGIGISGNSIFAFSGSTAFSRPLYAK